MGHDGIGCFSQCEDGAHKKSQDTDNEDVVDGDNSLVIGYEHMTCVPVERGIVVVVESVRKLGVR